MLLVRHAAVYSTVLLLVILQRHGGKVLVTTVIILQYHGGKVFLHCI
jgi:hypothetical protein